MRRWFGLAAVIAICGPKLLAADTLENRLQAESPLALAQEARNLGDARRGAIVFFQPQLACSRCHTVGEGENSLGPDLVRVSPPLDDRNLVEAVLQPSRSVRQGYAAISIQTVDGRTITGLLTAETTAGITVREATPGAAPVTIAAQDIELRQPSPTSIMPAGQVNQLTSRLQFLDLVCYLIEIRDGGAGRARELQPPAALIGLKIPEYEADVDHAGLIRDFNQDALARGEAIYNGLCINCHGTPERPGSLPTSLRFASGKFKNGSDPYAMYQTLTRGFGLMTPQPWMVPQQKYDVIHFIREAYLKPLNSSQYAAIDDGYLASLPQGTSRGPEPRIVEPWATMDYGPSLIHTYEVGDDGTNFAYKGIACRLDPGAGGIARGTAWMVFDHDTLRPAAAWFRDPESIGPAFVDWRGIQFNGEHQVHPRIAGDLQFQLPTGAGWADPETGRFDELRLRGRDGRPYGPLPRRWGRLKGIYAHEARTIISYTVGQTGVLEMPGLAECAPGTPAMTRTFNIGPRQAPLRMAVAWRPEDDPRLKIENGVATFAAPEALASTQPAAQPALLAGLSTPLAGVEWMRMGQRLVLQIPAGDEPLRFVLWTARAPRAESEAAPMFDDPQPDLDPWLHGGRPRWPETLQTQVSFGDRGGPFAADDLGCPDENPWLARLRLSGLDFFPGGDRLAVCSWDGDVWIVSGLSQLAADGADRRDVLLTWRRIASGLFQPLGLKIVDGRIYLTCRDQLCILNDLNGDGETDYYECFNSDQQVTEHFHEFAMGLQRDAEGNFYYAKSARHALPAVVPQHGTLLRVSPDGSHTEIVATGFRAANGVCLNDDGTFFVTDQEGHWTPKNRINWVRPGRFYGNMLGYHDVTDPSDSAMEPPLCWITNSFDRSPAELLWVTSPRWGSLQGTLLNLSYGYGKVYVVPHERVGDQMQGGMCELPIPQFPTGVMRGRFAPDDGQLYLCGMFAWAGNQVQAGGLYRLCATGKPSHLPVKLQATRAGMQIDFSDPLSPDSVADLSRFHVKCWSLKRTENYGSDHYDEHELRVGRAALSADGRTLSIDLPEIRPTWCMEIRYDVRGSDGSAVTGTIHNTVHQLADVDFPAQ